ncbi:MAG TPA: flagellar M-ring protein FliF [Thermoanaerobacterales bacterium]|nr:flagellar M-ring protein FliF [Thermoanaerobacterales bacterium]
MEFFQEIKQQATEYWQSRDKSQKIKIVFSIIALISVLGVLLYLVSRPKFVPLYSNLDIKDAGEIVKKLEDENITYKLEDDGKTILVHPEQKYRVRLSLAQEGLPKGGTLGFNDIFNNTRIGTTDWERQIQYNQALQGELTKAIEKMNAVETARIYIVQEEKSLFIDPDSERDPSAAVFLELKPSTDITKDEVTGIINLITYSVKNMKPENVTVVDQYGRTLSNFPFSPEENAEELINTQLVVQNNFQKQLEASVQSLLEQVFGLGNVAVRVNAKLNFDKKTVQNKLFSPVNEETGEGIVRSVQELKEYFSGTNADAGGSPGVDSNIPGYEQIQGIDSEQQRTEVIRNYDINETYENLTIAPGAVDKLTVSVVVNRELKNEERESIAAMVGNAIGYNPERDQISVEGIEFENKLAEFFADENARIEHERARNRNIMFIVALVFLLLLFVIIRTVMNRRRQKQEEDRLSEELIEMQQAAASRESDEQLLAQDDSYYAKIEKYARRSPEDIAKVLKTWLSED